MLNATLSILQRGCDAKLELIRGDLSAHIGCAYEMWEQRMRDEKLLLVKEQCVLQRDVLTELHLLGFAW
jgi:hypothetical protein